MVCPSSRTGREVLALHVGDNSVAQLGTESKVVDLVGKGVRVLVLEIVLEIVYMEIAVGERLSWRNVEVSNDFVYTNAALETASLLALCIEVLSVVLTFTLLDALTAAKGP